MCCYYDNFNTLTYRERVMLVGEYQLGFTRGWDEGYLDGFLTLIGIEAVIGIVIALCVYAQHVH